MYNQTRTQRHSVDCCECPDVCNNRTVALRLGALLVAVGLVWLAITIGWIPNGWYHSGFFWPVVIILVGLWIVIRGVLGGKGIFLKRP
jgi:hypothetical protein